MRHVAIALQRPRSESVRAAQMHEWGIELAQDEAGGDPIDEESWHRFHDEGGELPDLDLAKDDPRSGDPPKRAIDWFRRKKLKPGFDYRDVWKQEHAHAFTVAKAVREDVLQDLHDAVEQALAEGKSYDSFRGGIQNTLQEKGWWGKRAETDPKTGESKVVQTGSPARLRLIYDMNMRTARAIGQWDRIERVKVTRPYLLYQLGPAQRHRPEHESWSGTLLPVDDPFWDTHMPPNGWRCVCHLRQLSRTETESKGGETERPDTTEREWINKRTGQVEKVPIGIDPGFNYNAGKAAKRPASSDSYEPKE